MNQFLQHSKKKPFKFFTLRLCDCGSQRLPHNQSKHLPHLVFVAVSSCSGGFCQRQLSALTTVNVTFSYPVNDTKVELRNQTGMKLNLGFSCDSWPAVTAVQTVPPRPNKTRPTCSCFLVPLLCLSFSPFFSFLFFFLQKSQPLTFGVKYTGVGAEQRERQGCRVSRAQCEQLRGVISQAGSPLSGP